MAFLLAPQERASTYNAREPQSEAEIELAAECSVRSSLHEGTAWRSAVCTAHSGPGVVARVWSSRPRMPPMSMPNSLDSLLKLDTSKFRWFTVAPLGTDLCTQSMLILTCPKCSWTERKVRLRMVLPTFPRTGCCGTRTVA